MLSKDPSDIVVDALMHTMVGVRTLSAATRPLRAAMALIDDARAYVVAPLGSAELVCAAVRELVEGNGRAAEVAAVWAALAHDLAAVEAEGDSREIHVAWAVWHLARAVAALDEGSGPLAAARVRDLAHCVFRAMTWEGDEVRDTPGFGPRAQGAGRVTAEPETEGARARRVVERAVAAKMLERVTEAAARR